MRDPLDLEAALLDKRQPFVRLRARLDLPKEELDEAEHAEEGIVDLVREAADQLSEPGQPTGFEEGLPLRGLDSESEGRGRAAACSDIPFAIGREGAA